MENALAKIGQTIGMTFAPDTYMAVKGARENQKRQNALAMAGKAFQAGDYQSAAAPLFESGNLEGGISVLNYGRDQQNRAREQEQQFRTEDLQGLYRVASEARQMPLEQRLAYVTEASQRMGVPAPQSINDLTDEEIDRDLAMLRPQLQMEAPQAEVVEPKWEEVTIQTANGPVIKMYDANSRDPMSTLMDVGAAVPKTPLSQVNVNTGSPGDNRPLTDKPTKDFQRVWDEEGQTYRDEVIPGTATARENELLNSKAFQSLQANQEQFDAIMTNIEAADELIGPFTAGAGSYLQVIRGTPARDLEARLETVKANIGFDKLNEMRQTSPTGGALGQVTERELKFLQSVRGSIDEQQSPAQLRQTLQEIRESLLRLKEVRDIAFKLEQQNAGEGQIVSTDPLQSGDLPDGFALQGEDADLLEFMTPEERALFAGGGQ